MLKIISAIVAKSRTEFYSVQCFMQLVSQRFLPLQDMLNGAMTRATCLAMALRDKLHEKLHRVTGPALLTCCSSHGVMIIYTDAAAIAIHVAVIGIMQDYI
jgi:hypothetical protein